MKVSARCDSLKDHAWVKWGSSEPSSQSNNGSAAFRSVRFQLCAHTALTCRNTKPPWEGLSFEPDPLCQVHCSELTTHSVWAVYHSNTEPSFSLKYSSSLSCSHSRKISLWENLNGLNIFGYTTMGVNNNKWQINKTFSKPGWTALPGHRYMLFK